MQIGSIRKLTAFFFLSFLFFVSSTAKAAPIPPPGRIPCEKIDDPEFHSLRPYQASPCADPPKAVFCGNDLIFTETYKNFPECEEQAPANEGAFFCRVNRRIAPHELSVDLQGGEFPILGNTQDVKNSQTPAEALDDTQKVNEYASWYLSGVTDKAEYGKTNPDKVADFSGPAKKLLPSIIQDSLRIKTIETASKRVNFKDEDSGKTTSDTENHNQIVVCGKSNLGIIGDLFNIGSLTPAECYKGDGSKAKTLGKEVLRLKDWEGNLSFWNSFIDRIVGLLVKLLPDVPENIIRKSVLRHWKSRKPPLPWENDPFENRPMTALEYRKYYNEWRGKTCVIIPLLNQLICFDNILVPNKYADLFSYVPLASTADKVGREKINDVQFQTGEGTELTDTSYKEPLSPGLYFAHTQEVKDISESLNKTYTPSNFKGTSLPTTEVNDPASCRVVDVRSNEGDDLFPGIEKNNPADTIIPDVTYTITQVPCKKEITREYDPDQGWSEKVNIDCQAEINIVVKMITKVPWADEIWKQTVAESGSTFRKIFPKVEEGAPVSCVADIPAATSVNYQPVKGNLTQVKNPGDSPASSPELYFPHLGSVYEYFLKGIQTALRPKGYGEPISNGTNCSNLACGELPNLPKATGSCKLGGISPRVGNLPQSLKDIIEAASETYKTPPGLILGVMYGEGLFNPGRFDWTDENVKNWATCQKVPGCSETGADHFMGFFSSNWQEVKNKIAPDLKKLDPNRPEPNQCNLLDAIYGVAWNLHDSADGGMPFTCFGIDLNAPVPSSCSWNDNQYESAIKVHESGYTDMCMTREGGCAIGGIAAACPTGGDTCETISNRYANPSHNACVWDVAHGK